MQEVWDLLSISIALATECVFQNILSIIYLRPVPTKWETSRKISFPSYSQIHVAQTLSFKMIYYMSWLLPYLRSKNYYFLVNSFVFYWFLKCSMSPISFSSLATCPHFVRTGLIYNCVHLGGHKCLSQWKFHIHYIPSYQWQQNQKYDFSFLFYLVICMISSIYPSCVPVARILRMHTTNSVSYSLLC